MKISNTLILFIFLGSLSSVANSDNSAQGALHSVLTFQAQSSVPPMRSELQKNNNEPMIFIESIEYSALDKLERLSEWNRYGKAPQQNGVVHKLEHSVEVAIQPKHSLHQSGNVNSKTSVESTTGELIQTANGDIVWSSSVMIDNSYRLRAYIAEVILPEDAEIWVEGANEETIGPFGSELLDETGGFWTPSVAGPELKIYVVLPGQEPFAEFEIAQVTELFELDRNGEPKISQPSTLSTTCFEDSQCISSSTFAQIDNVERAVAHIQFVKDGSSYICTGGLVNDTVDDSWIPYFLTANHCLDSQSSASSIEAFWDYKPSSCDGYAPSLSTRPRSNGAVMLETGSTGDFTLLRLNSVPAGRYFLGWHPAQSAIEPGTKLHRISHPSGDVQHYSQTVVGDGGNMCAGLPKSSFLYQMQNIGGTSGGSSGAPVVNDAGQLVGQLYGDCGDNIGDDCDYSNAVVDGALHSYYHRIANYLRPETQNPADLSITVLDARSGTYGPTDTLDVTSKIKNVGELDSNSYRITFYASTNTQITTSDYVLNSWSMDALSPNEEHHYNFPNVLSEGIPIGEYYIGAILTVSDSNSANNISYDPIRVTIEKTEAPQAAPDLYVVSIDAKGVGHYLGDQLAIETWIGNSGSASSGSYSLLYYLSTDSTINDRDILVGRRNQSSLNENSNIQFNDSWTLPSNISEGLYYVGVVISQDANDSDPSNDIKYDGIRVRIEKRPEQEETPFEINPGLNGSWFYPQTNGQGFLIEVLPKQGTLFLAWFTYDSTRPPSNYVAKLGEPGHRWLTAQGPYSGSIANLEIYSTSGGVFDKSSPGPTTNHVGTMSVEFSGCNKGTVTYYIPGVAIGQVIPIQRISADNIELCESLK